MPLQIQHDQLTYRNQAFAVHHLIDDCPPFTVIRELVKNAVENASQLKPPGRIEWFAELVAGVPKLGLYNEGPGMSGIEIFELMDLASTAKVLGTDANYGQGAKVSGLKASPHGIVYRSCRQGRVSQITLMAESKPNYDFPIYVKRRERVRDDNGEAWVSVLDITDQYAGSRERRLDRDWTEVVLLGKNAEHDTVAALLSTHTMSTWLIRLVNSRFYRLPRDVAISRSNLSTQQGEDYPRNAEGLEPLTANWSERYEDIAIHHPKYGQAVVRYCKLKGNWQESGNWHSRQTTMMAYGIGSRGDHICLVWKDECYDMKTGWSRISGPFGVTFGSANIAIQILLPDIAPVKNNTYRDAIIERGENHQPVAVEEFADVVRQARPQWLINYVEEQGRKSCNDGTDVRERLKAFLEFLKVQAQTRPVVADLGVEEGEVENHDKTGEEEEHGGNGERKRGHKPTTGKRQPTWKIGIPDVQFTTDPAILEQMKGRAAIYSSKDGAPILFLNPEHWKYIEDMNRLYEQVGPSEDRRQLAKKIFDEEYKFNAGRYVILSWIFRGKAEWSEKDWEAALNKETLTVYLCSPDSLEDARRKINQKLNSRKMEAIENGN